ncbi:MAG: type I-C CRISPR-associated endonuclease Cas1c [Kiritimatiellia bacterium]
MKKYLNTLYVTTQGAYLNKEGEAVVVNIDREVKLRVPVHTLGGIVCFGNVMMSPFLMRHCAENNVGMSFLTESGRFLARVAGPQSGNVLLRRQQYKASDDPKLCSAVVRAVLLAKMVNCRTLLQRAARDHKETAGTQDVQRTVTRLGDLVRGLKADKHRKMEELRGMEGEAGKIYFEVFDNLITAQKEDFFFKARSRRPPMDNVNALLSFVYTLLVHDCRSAVEAVGLDPQVGFLHRQRPGRPSLALDLMEEFRPFFADRLVLSLINLRQVQGKDFKKSETGGVRMSDEARKTVITAYQKRKQDELVHPFLKESAPVGTAMHLQAQLLARFLRGDLDGYPAFLWR